MVKIAHFEGKTAAVKGDVDVVFVQQDGSKKPIAPKGPYQALVEKFRKSEGFSAKSSQTQFIAFAGKGSTHVLFVGVGPDKNVPAEKLRFAGAAVLGKLATEKMKSAVIDFDSLIEGLSTVDAGKAIQAFGEGLALSAYKFDKYKKKETDDKGFVGPEKIYFFSKKKELKDHLSASARDVTFVAECVNLTRDWSNEPSNFGTPEYYASEAKRLAKAHGISCKILSESDAKKEKMGLFLAVGAGSEREGKIVVLDYHPKGAEKTIALVGKGITMDTGGFPLSPRCVWKR